MGDEHKNDLRDLRDTVQQELRDGFQGVHTRLDTLNGRVGRGEVATGQHAVRLVNLEREVFRRRRGDPDEPAHAGRAVAGRAVTDRDVRIVWMTLAAIVAAIEFGLRLVPMLVKLVAR